VQAASAWEHLARVWVVGGVFVHELPPGLQQGGQRAMPPVLTGTEFAMREHRQMRRHKAAASRTPPGVRREGEAAAGHEGLRRLALVPTPHTGNTPTRRSALASSTDSNSWCDAVTSSAATSTRERH
jgi:hypothetical protein